MVLVGLVFGFIVGVALVAGFQYVMQHRSRNRIKKAAGLQLLNSLQEEGLRRLCGSSFPIGISFLTYEKVNWMNSTLKRFWPYVVQATEPLVKEQVGAVLENYKPPGISSLKMDKFNIGKVPPLIDGVRIQSLRKGQVIMDLDFKWGGEASIILAINPVVGPKLPVQLKNLSIFATIRVIFQLSEDIPCISALVVALLSKPKFKIKYDLKVIGGSTGAIPGLGDMIEDLVESSVSDTLEWPHRIVVPVGNTPANVLSDLGLKLQGKLSVTVVRCTNLKNMEKLGKSDPYVRFYVRVLFKLKSTTKNNNLNPEWNESFEFDVEDSETQTLVLQVKDEDIGSDKLMGVTTVSLNDLKPDIEEEVTKKLTAHLDTDKYRDKGDRGTITLKLKFHPYTKEEQEMAMEAEKKLLKAKEDLKNSGVIGGAMDAVGGGVKLVGTGMSTVGSGIGAGVGVVGSGFKEVGSGLGKAGKLMSGQVKRLTSSNKLVSPAASTPANGSPMHENGAIKLKEL